jgi:hypothetical protein
LPRHGCGSATALHRMTQLLQLGAYPLPGLDFIKS